MNTAPITPTRPQIDARTLDAVTVCRSHADLLGAEGDASAVLRGAAAVLAGAGLAPREVGRGLVCDIAATDGPGDGAGITLLHGVAGRGGPLGAIPALAAALVLADIARADGLDRAVRIVIDDPAGAGAHAHDDGVLHRVDQAFAVRTDPGLAPAHLAISSGSVAYSTDRMRILLAGPGGHTARPHLTTDLVMALAKVATELPFAVSRRLDPRAAFRVDWYNVMAGEATNVIPQSGVIDGTARILDTDAWTHVPELVEQALAAVVAPYEAKWSLEYRQGEPPVMNGPAAVIHARSVAFALFGPEAVESRAGIVDGWGFGPYAARVPGALVRIGAGGRDDGLVAAARFLAGASAHRGR